MVNNFTLPDNVIIGIEDFKARLTECVADLEGTNTRVEDVLANCVDFAKMHLSEQFIEYFLQKEYRKFLEDLHGDKEEPGVRLCRFINVVIDITRYIERELLRLAIVDPDSYVPYKMSRMLGQDSIVLCFRGFPITNLENPESKRFDPRADV